VNSVALSETVLPTGMRLVEMPLGGRLATAISVLFPAGARHERATEVGAGHLLEHLAFKGTENHPTAAELNRAAEYLGTELGGASTVDYVEFSTFVRAQSAMAAVELLIEVTATPRLAPDDLEHERAVILQELADDDDDLGARAGDLLQEALFAGHRLAKNVAGTAADVRSLSLPAVLAFRDRQWSPTGGLVAIGGNLAHVDRERLNELIARLPDRPAPPPSPPLPPFGARVAIEQRDSNVVHLRLAYHLPGLDFRLRRDRAHAEVFSQLLAGPMGSRLYDELREQRPLCYWVSAGVSDYAGRPILFVSCSVGPSDLEQAYERIAAILTDLRAHGPSDEEARRFRAYSTGAVARDFESVTNRLDHAIELIMEYGDYDVDPVLLLREIDGVTRRDLTALAAEIDPSPCVACVGSETAPFESSPSPVG
jgi:predicted Zn-dependent peptidase